MDFYDSIQIYSKYLVTLGRSKETIRGYLTDLRFFNIFVETHYNGQVELTDIERKDIEDYLVFLKVEKNYANKSIARNVASLKAFFSYFKECDLIDKNPADGIKAPKIGKKLPNYLTREEVLRLAEEINSPTIQAAVLTIYYTGARISELTNLKLNHVNFENSTILFHGKGDKSRIVPISADLKIILENYFKNHRADVTTDYFFATKKSGSISNYYVLKSIKKAALKIGITKNVSCHTLRHSFATSLYKQGVDLKKISKLLGHESITTTDIYTHFDNKELAQAVDVL